MTLRPTFNLLFAVVLAAILGSWAERSTISLNTSKKVDGYQGIWFTLNQFFEEGDKYSGGLGTYTAKHVPMAIYAPEVDKTFFVYGGAKEGQRHLLAMASYYDHLHDLVPDRRLYTTRKMLMTPMITQASR